MKTIKDLIALHPFFAGLPAEDLEFVSGCGRNMRFQSGDYLGREGDPADRFYIIRDGLVAVETHVPGRVAVTAETLDSGDVAGWSWLFPPYRWTFDLRAKEPTSVIAMDGRCLRDKCEREPRLGYELMKRLAGIMTRRLRSTRLSLLDMYGEGGRSS